MNRSCWERIRADWLHEPPPIEREFEPPGELVIRAGPPNGAELRLLPNGDILVNGRIIVNDVEVVAGLREIVTGTRPPPVPAGPGITQLTDDEQIAHDWGLQGRVLHDSYAFTCSLCGHMVTRPTNILPEGNPPPHTPCQGRNRPR
jgi:hypothetical protein